MGRNKDLLSNVQVVSLVASAIIGVTISTLPRTVVEDAGLNGVIGLVVGGVVSMLLTVLIAMLAGKFPDAVILEYGRNLLGPIFSKVMITLWLVYFTALTGVVHRIFADAIKAFLLENTPIEIIILSMLVVTAYLAQNGINPIARICEAFFPVIIGSIFIVLLLSLQNFNVKEFYSLGQINVTDILKIIPITVISYLGFELLLFVSAFTIEPQKIMRNGLIGVGISLVTYTAAVVLSVGVFSVDSLKYQIYPMLELAKTIAFPGAFAERFDVFFAIFWILAVFTTVVIFYYLGAISLTKLFGLKNYRPFTYLFVPVIYVISLLPQEVAQVNQFTTWVSYLGGSLVTVIPVLLLAVAFVRKKGGSKSEDT